MFDEYTEKLKADAEQLILEHFPRKIIELDALLKSEKFNRDEIKSEVNIPPSEATRIEDLVVNPEMSGDGVKVMTYPNRSSPCNKHIVELVDIVKPLFEKFDREIKFVEKWITHLTPKIEDGNNVGVTIQKMMLTTLEAATQGVIGSCEQITTYFVNRASLVCQLAKFPSVDDIRRGIAETDELEYLFLRLCVIKLIYNYSILHDKFTKNWEKITKPKGEASLSSMY